MLGSFGSGAEVKISNIKQKPYPMFMALPKVMGESTVFINGVDGTDELVCQYMDKYKSPMYATCANFSQTFQKYDINPVFALSVAMCESNLGKKMPIPISQNCHDNIQVNEGPDECCHNPFGYGVHSAGTLCFDTWEEGYQFVARDFKRKYSDQGLKTIDDIMSKYNKISAEERNGSWGKCVKQFTDEISALKIRNY